MSEAVAVLLPLEQTFESSRPKSLSSFRPTDSNVSTELQSPLRRTHRRGPDRSDDRILGTSLGRAGTGNRRRSHVGFERAVLSHFSFFSFFLDNEFVRTDRRGIGTGIGDGYGDGDGITPETETCRPLDGWGTGWFGRRGGGGTAL